MRVNFFPRIPVQKSSMNAIHSRGETAAIIPLSSQAQIHVKLIGISYGNVSRNVLSFPIPHSNRPPIEKRHGKFRKRETRATCARKARRPRKKILNFRSKGNYARVKSPFMSLPVSTRSLSYLKRDKRDETPRSLRKGTETSEKRSVMSK